MKKTIKIDSKKYTTIVKSIETSAEDCLLDEKEWLSYRKTKGTDIARYIAKQAKSYLCNYKALKIDNVYGNKSWLAQLLFLWGWGFI